MRELLNDGATKGLDVFDSSRYEGTRRSFPEASVLPAICYTSPEWYQREIETMFMRDWLMVGRGERIPNVGDYFTIDIAGEPILVVRDREQQVRAFSAACRHRGTPIASGDGNCKSFRCPYHSWVYSLEGALMGAPEMHRTPGFDRADYGLIPVKLDTWGGFLFVNLDPASDTLAAFLGDLPRRMAKYRLDELVWTRRKAYDLECNWKVYVDNSIECYHLPTVHAKTIEAYAPMDAWVPEPADGSYLMLYGVFPETLALLEGQKGFELIAGLAGDTRHDIPWIFPNTHILATTDTVWWLTMYPMGPERTRVEVNSCFPKAATERPDFEEVAAQYYKRLDTTNPEDNRIAELQQRGLRARLGRSGRYCSHEKLVHEFANYVLDKVLGPA